jgi:hypothetical protein
MVSAMEAGSSGLRACPVDPILRPMPPHSGVSRALRFEPTIEATVKAISERIFALSTD